MILRLPRLFLTATMLLAAVALTKAQDEKEPPKKEKDKAPAVPMIAPADEEYRQFFKKPTNVAEFWAAMQFEIEVARLDLAVAHLHGLLDLKPAPEELFKLADQVGMAAFLRLRNIRVWTPVPRVDEKGLLAEVARLEKDRDDVEKIARVKLELEKQRKARADAILLNSIGEKDVEELIGQVTAAVRKTLSDPERIKKYVKNLTASKEEKEYALKELYRSGAAVAPYLIAELGKVTDADRPAVLEAMSRLGAELLPALAAALDSDSERLKSDLIDIFLKRGAVETVPYLWYLSASENQPDRVREKALGAISDLLEIPASKLPPAKVELTRQANRYYRHEIPFADPKAVTVWRWDGKTVVPLVLPGTKAEEYYGLRFAGQALMIDPAYEPAQVALLSVALDKGVEQGGVTQPLAVSNPAVYELLGTVNPDLVTAVLERALNERRFNVILGAVQALGEFREMRASRPTGRGEPALVRALNYPDRRIQMAAAEAMLRMPGAQSGQASVRVVEILRRVLAAEPAAAKTAGKVLVGFFVPDLGERVAEAVAKAGFEPVKVRTGKEVMERLRSAADIDLLLLDEALPDPGLAFLLANLRADQNAARLPLLLSAAPEREDAVRRFVGRYSNVTVLPFALALDPKELEIAFRAKVADPSASPLSEAEAKEYAEKAIRHLARMARGELPGYDMRPADKAILGAVRAGRLTQDGQIAALDAAGRLPGREAQTDLLGVVVDGRRPGLVRFIAADLLTRHIQRHSLLLGATQLQALQTAYAQAAADPPLKARIAVVLGTLRPDARLTGQRLRDFRPAAAQPPPPRKEPPPEKEKP